MCLALCPFLKPCLIMIKVCSMSFRSAFLARLSYELSDLLQGLSKPISELDSRCPFDRRRVALAQPMLSWPGEGHPGEVNVTAAEKHLRVQPATAWLGMTRKTEDMIR